MTDVLYCGDATLATGACYLGGVMTYAGISFDYVPMNDRFPEELLDHDVLSTALELLEGLDVREATVLRMRFGLGDQEPRTLKEIGEELGLWRES